MKYIFIVLATSAYAQIMTSIYQEDFRFFFGGVVTGILAVGIFLYNNRDCIK